MLARCYCHESTIEETVEKSTIVLNNRLEQFYLKYHREHPRTDLSRIKTIKRSSLGDQTYRTVKTKGAETYGLLLFFKEELGYHTFAEKHLYLACCTALVDLVQLWDRCGWVLTEIEIAETYRHWNRFVSVSYGLESLEQPKRHLADHLIDQIRHFGNPRYYGTWRDESLNKPLRRACRDVSQLTFEASVLSGMRYLLEDELGRHL